MRAFFFLLGMVGIIVGAFYYLNRDSGVEFSPNNSFCRDLEKKQRENEEYIVSYSERAKAVAYGCFREE